MLHLFLFIFLSSNRRHDECPRLRGKLESDVIYWPVATAPKCNAVAKEQPFAATKGFFYPPWTEAERAATSHRVEQTIRASHISAESQKLVSRFDSSSQTLSAVRWKKSQSGFVSSVCCAMYCNV